VGQLIDGSKAMKDSARIAPVAALLSAVLSITCCLPLGIPAGIGLAGIGMLMDRLQPWLMALSLVFLTVGLVQLYRQRACQRRNLLNLVIFCIAATIVLALIFFPQVVASILADRL
jgi:hypothetical protein